MLVLQLIPSVSFLLASFFAGQVFAWGSSSSRQNPSIYRETFDGPKYRQYKDEIEEVIIPKIKETTESYLRRYRGKETKPFQTQDVRITPDIFMTNQHDFRVHYYKLLETLAFARRQIDAFHSLFEQHFGDIDDYLSIPEEIKGTDLEKDCKDGLRAKHNMRHWLRTQEIEIEELAPFTKNATDVNLFLHDDIFMREIRVLRAKDKEDWAKRWQEKLAIEDLISKKELKKYKKIDEKNDEVKYKVAWWDKHVRAAVNYKRRGIWAIKDWTVPNA